MRIKILIYHICMVLDIFKCLIYILISVNFYKLKELGYTNMIAVELYFSQEMGSKYTE